MRRSALLTIAVLGGVVSLLGGTVLYAGLQDTARTGTNSAESAALGTSADIQLARGTLSTDGTNVLTCGTFSENLTTGLFTATGVSPGYQSPHEYVCIKNVGSQQVTLTSVVDELTDVDIACTGDEAANGDTTCGGDGLGELSTVLRATYGLLSACNPGTSAGGESATLKFYETATALLGSLAPGATSCHVIGIDYPAATANTDVQKAQSDRVTWRFKYSAQA